MSTRSGLAASQAGADSSGFLPTDTVPHAPDQNTVTLDLQISVNNLRFGIILKNLIKSLFKIYFDTFAHKVTFF